MRVYVLTRDNNSNALLVKAFPSGQMMFGLLLGKDGVHTCEHEARRRHNPRQFARFRHGKRLRPYENNEIELHWLSCDI